MRKLQKNGIHMYLNTPHNEPKHSNSNLHKNINTPIDLIKCKGKPNEP